MSNIKKLEPKKPETCPYCEDTHTQPYQCPRLAAIDWDERGNILRVEFFDIYELEDE